MGGVTACRTDAGDSRLATRFALANTRWRVDPESALHREEDGRATMTRRNIQLRFSHSKVLTRPNSPLAFCVNSPFFSLKFHLIYLKRASLNPLVANLDFARVISVVLSSEYPAESSTRVTGWVCLPHALFIITTYTVPLGNSIPAVAEARGETASVCREAFLETIDKVSVSASTASGIIT